MYGSSSYEVPTELGFAWFDAWMQINKAAVKDKADIDKAKKAIHEGMKGVQKRALTHAQVTRTRPVI